MAKDGQHEIDEIMNEIQSLQEGMAQATRESLTPDAALTPDSVTMTAPVTAVVEPPSTLTDFHAAANDAPMEETLGEIIDDTATPPPTTVEEQTDSELEENWMNTLEATDETSVTLSLKGRMTLRLTYECEGQEVIIGFEDGCLKLELSDGTEFKVPVARPNGRILRAA